MRIVAGIWRGRRIEAPKGSDTTRPTTDRTRESVASMIMSDRDLSLDGCSVLDAFAGSGAMGFELLSRGADHATFVDSSRPAIRVINQNANVLGAKNLVTVLAGDITRLAGTSALKGAPFDVIYLDPPYALSSEDVSALLSTLIASDQVAIGATVVYEYAAGESGLDVPELIAVKTKKLGSTAVDLYRFGEEHG